MTRAIRTRDDIASSRHGGTRETKFSFATHPLMARVNLWEGVPFYLLIALLVIVTVAQPNAFSYTGFTLLLSTAVPLALATISQMFIMAAGDIDLGIGSFVGLVNVISALVLVANPLLAVVLYVALVAAYVLMGLLVHYRQLPAIVVTLGASFIWLGLAIIALPSPGGTVPSYIVDFFGWSPPVIPGPIVFLVAIAAVANFVLMRNRYGAVLRGSGSNAEAIARAGWSVAATKGTLYGLAGIFAVLSGLALSASTTSGDANNGASYVLLSIVAVIVGGGKFSGGIVAPAGAVAGAVVVVLIGSILTFLNISSDYQIGAQGLILVLAMAIRAVQNKRDGKRI
jgi:ribose/xylose/arabinose/galactoside ABC-type transport system permease subunit